ncbi:AMP-binding protein [Hyphococcus lacteus]|uniref:AMP-binding protein n=1 Tax=Hyphococcus lacteus TaxID=3143536 RepID=A0ABV3Z7H0_9PROT
MKTIFELFTKAATTHPDKVLFERPGLSLITYRDTSELAAQFAGALATLGVEAGDRVAVQADKSPEYIALYLGVLQLGAVFLPLNTAYTKSEIEFFLEDATPRLFICDPMKISDHACVKEGVLCETLGANGDGSLIDLAAQGAPCREFYPSSINDPAAILYTSGTTGRSKGAILTHGNLASNCAALLDSWQFTSADRLIHALPVFHTHGLFVAVNMTLAAGATMIFLTQFDADQIIDLMDEATVLMGVPTFYSRLLQVDRLDRTRTSGMRLFVSGSAPLLAEEHKKFKDRTGHAILERYGMTETCMIATNPYGGERIPGAVGHPLPGIKLRIAASKSGEVLPVGETGVIEVKGPNVFAGYWKMPEKTAEEFRADGFFITGDLGMIGEDGYLRIVGREKDLIISGGYNIYPKEIEEVIDARPGVMESAVIGVHHHDMGECPIAVVVPIKGCQLDSETIIRELRGKIARFKVPRHVIIQEHLPRNVMGKVQKAALRQKYAEIAK